jgi:GT2 family glycosyltransferase
MAETTPPISLIVLCWNRWPLTRRCLTTLAQTDLTNAEVLVVDNGSTDETPRELSAFPFARVLRLPQNCGFVRGNNAGLGEVSPDSDVVLLNNDLVFSQPDWLPRLREAAHAAPDIGIAGCRLVLPDGRLLHAGTYILPDTLWGQQIGALEQDLGQYPGTREVDGIVFACAYIRREVLGRIGGLSLDYQSYFEDTDFCQRAREAGYRTVVCGGVTLVHDEHGSTQGADTTRQAIFQQSRKAFAARWQETLEARYRHQVLWQSILNVPTGYAMSCREIIKALDVEGVRVSYRYVYGPGTVFPKPEPEVDLPHRLGVMLSRPAPKRPGVAVVYGQADVFSRNQGKYKIGYTMLEVDGFPRDWVKAANRMDEVWVPSAFNREGFLRSGLERPIQVMPLGVDTDYFHPGARAVPNPHGEFVFLTVFEWGERKEPWLLLKAFNETFTAKEPVRLLCKVMNRDKDLFLRDEISKLGLRPSGGRISWLFNLEFPHYQLPMLYRSADCFVAVSRGEGWNMPLMEALACGTPAIATNWGPHPEFFHEGIGFPLNIRGTVPAVARCPYYDGFSWADPDQDHLRHLLRQVYEHPEEARLRGLAAAREMASQWSWRGAARRIVERLAAVGA